MKLCLIFLFLGAIAALSLAGCQHRSGVASFRFVDSSPTQAPTDARKLEITDVKTVLIKDAKPLEPLAVPIYPPAALAARLPIVIITVKITVGKDGRVKEVGPSLAGLTLPTRFDREFREAIETAVALWGFEPAREAELEPTKDGPPAVVRTDDVETTFDITFTFSSSGKVSTGSPTK